ncbi:MAG: urate hydroxylase PuuD [Alphaproteobacteria bacterium]|nr:urate hydroxylase PuuD [Alphaproteobacteria bacterium]MBV9903863.1 urate hydroxylase PuuD [Alphaproteobacteria bacterium]
MAAFLGNLRNVVIAGFILAILVIALRASQGGLDLKNEAFWAYIIRTLHVASGVMWIGLLWYFNFVSTPTMPTIPTELRPALGKYITPAALFWFRWGAMSTLVFGILLAGINHYLVQAYTLDAVDATGRFSNISYILIGIGMWLATIMWFNVWFVIWPNQQKALNIGDRYSALDPAAKTAAGATAGQFSRINTMLSIPMLFCMVAASHMP